MRPVTSEDKVSKVLGEPVGFDISETARKLRRNLMLVSIVVIVLILGEIEPGKEFSLLGIALTGVTPVKLMIGLAIGLVYHLTHYMWYCYEIYLEWSIRVTGTRLSFVTAAKLASKLGDYPADPKQSTLYSWWQQEARSMASYEELVQRFDSSIRGLDEHLESLQACDMTPAGTVSRALQATKDTIEQLRHSLASTESVIQSSRIPASLGRFDNRFKNLLQAQNLRVLFIELMVPVVMSLFAAYLLAGYFLLNKPW